MFRAIVLAIVTLTVLSQAASAEEPAAKAELVRKIAVTVEPLAAATLPGKPGVTVVNDEKGVKDSFGEAIAKQIAGKVDFATEDMVYVSWGSSGPPFAKLRHEIKDEKDGKTITFLLQQPKTLVQGQAFQFGNDFFAVPKGAKVKFGGTK